MSEVKIPILTHTHTVTPAASSLPSQWPPPPALSLSRLALVAASSSEMLSPCFGPSCVPRRTSKQQECARERARACTHTRTTTTRSTYLHASRLTRTHRRTLALAADERDQTLVVRFIVLRLLLPEKLFDAIDVALQVLEEDALVLQYVGVGLGLVLRLVAQMPQQLLQTLVICSRARGRGGAGRSWS